MHLRPCKTYIWIRKLFLTDRKVSATTLSVFELNLPAHKCLSQRIRVWSTTFYSKNPGSCETSHAILPSSLSGLQSTRSFWPDPESSRKQMYCCWVKLHVCGVKFDPQNVDKFYWKHSMRQKVQEVVLASVLDAHAKEWNQFWYAIAFRRFDQIWLLFNTISDSCRIQTFPFRRVDWSLCGFGCWTRQLSVDGRWIRRNVSGFKCVQIRGDGVSVTLVDKCFCSHTYQG